MDKLLHIALSYAIILTAYLFVHNIFIAIGIGIVPTIGKEIYDYIKIKQGATERSRDLICDGVGIILATIITFLI